MPVLQPKVLLRSLLVVLATLPFVGSSNQPILSARAASAVFPVVTSVDTMKDSKDTVTNRLTAAQIGAEVRMAASLNTTHIAVDTPYDAPDYTRQWIDAIHAAGKHVWLRPHFNQWEGDYGATGIMTPTQYERAEAAFLRAYPTLLRPGDIFDPCPEPENGKYWAATYGQSWDWSPTVPNAATREYNAFIRDTTTIAQNTLQSLGINGVVTTIRSVNGWIATHDLEPATVGLLGRVTIDSYPEGSTTDPTTAARAQVDAISSVETMWHVPVVLGEMGYSTAALVDDQTQEAVLRAEFTALRQLPYLAGINYWVGAGDAQYDGTRLITGSRDAWTLRPAARDLAALYAVEARQTTGTVAETAQGSSAMDTVASIAQQSPATVANGVRVAGNRLVTMAGQPVRLLGVNHSGSEYACIQGWGIFDGPTDSASVSAISAWHATAVRIPLNEDCWLGINGVPTAYGGVAYQQAIAAYVKTITQAGLVAILDLHWNAPGSTRSTGQEPMADRDHAPDFWRSVASAFKDNAAVVFDLYNEPHDISWQCWRDGGTCAGVSYPVAGMQDLVNAVRGTGATNVILVGGLAWANDLSGWLSYAPHDPLNNMGAAWHVYNNNACNTLACYDAQAAPVAAQVPLVVGEFAENDKGTSFITPLLTWLDAHGASYCAWAWAAWGDWQSLISSYNGTPTAWFGVPYQTHLAAIAASSPVNVPLPTSPISMATSTAVPPTATSTAVPPTATSTAVPPTATSTAVPSGTSEEGASVDLAPFIANTGTSSDGGSGGTAPGDFDGQGYSYSAQALQAAGFVPGQTATVGGVPFHWPAAAPNGSDNVVARGQTLPLAIPVSGATLAVLGAADHGPATGTITLHYSDGATQSATLGLPDWTLNGGSARPPAGVAIAAAMGYRDNRGRPEPIETDVFVASLPLLPGKALSSVTLPASVNQGRLHLFALTVEGSVLAATATPPSVPPVATSTGTPPSIAPVVTATSTPPSIAPVVTATSTPPSIAPVVTATSTPSPLIVAYNSVSVSSQMIAFPGTETFTATLTLNKSLDHELVDFEVYNAAGARIWQGWRSPVTFTANEPQTFTQAWPITAMPAPGTYTLKMGLFTSSWQGQQWNNGAATFAMATPS